MSMNRFLYGYKFRTHLDKYQEVFFLDHMVRVCTVVTDRTDNKMLNGETMLLIHAVAVMHTSGMTDYIFKNTQILYPQGTWVSYKASFNRKCS